jgi:uncharacterized membrane protein YeiH
MAFFGSDHLKGFVEPVKMDKLHALYNFLDLAGTFVFAISGAVAAKQRGLDLFGICVIAFTVACGGGIIRDLCIGAAPPAGLTNWHYLAAAIIASGMTVGLYSFVHRLNQPVLFFDALGLSLFAVNPGGASRHSRFIRLIPDNFRDGRFFHKSKAIP